MAQVTTIDVTTLIGSDTFPVNVNDVYGLIETLASQNIRAVRSSNRIVDGFFEYEVENGTVVEEAIIKMAEKQTFVKTGQPDLSPKDPALKVKYFNNWEEAQFKTTVRRSDIRKIIANKGVGLDTVVAEILDTLTQGEGYYDYGKMHAILNDTSVGEDGYTAIGHEGAVAKTMKGVLFALREAYNVLKATNKAGLPSDGFTQATPVEDIRIAISETLLNMIDVTELANLFNLSKEELFGKLVVIPFADTGKASVLVYDRKALGRGTRLYEFSQDVLGVGLYTNHYLTTERCYFYNSLFKAIRFDFSLAYNDAIDTLFDTSEVQE